MFWLYPATLRFSFGHRLENDWEGTESTHWVHPRKRKPRFVQRQKRRCFANSIPFSPHARMQLMQSILQLKTSFIWFHAHWILELCLAHHRSTVWAILPSVAAFFPADTSLYLMGDRFKNQPLLLHCKNSSLPQAACRQKHVYLHLSKHRGKTTAPWRKLIPKPFWNVINSLLPEWIDTLIRINKHLP